MLSRARTGETMEHQPVLLRETLELIRPAPGAVLVDTTLGAGGHAEALLAAVGPGGKIYGIDRDPEAVALARRRLSRFEDRFVALRGNHLDLIELLQDAGVFAVDGILADLGVSSLQLNDPKRGFSFRLDGPLDMRMDPDSGPSAAELLDSISELELRRILWTYGEEKRAGAIARAVVRRRAERPIRSTAELAELVARVAGPKARQYRIHPATRTFQALRIAVNHEVEGLDKLVSDAVSLLRPGGRLAVISFHSLEDRKIKEAFKTLAERCICPPGLPICGCGRRNLVKIVTPRPVRPDAAEISVNPRSRSARLRVAEKL